MKHSSIPPALLDFSCARTPLVLAVNTLEFRTCPFAYCARYLQFIPPNPFFTLLHHALCPCRLTCSVSPRGSQSVTQDHSVRLTWAPAESETLGRSLSSLCFRKPSRCF